MYLPFQTLSLLYPFMPRLSWKCGRRTDFAVIYWWKQVWHLPLHGLQHRYSKRLVIGVMNLDIIMEWERSRCWLCCCKYMRCFPINLTKSLLINANSPLPGNLSSGAFVKSVADEAKGPQDHNYRTTKTLNTKLQPCLLWRTFLCHDATNCTSPDATTPWSPTTTYAPSPRNAPSSCASERNAAYASKRNDATTNARRSTTNAFPPNAWNDATNVSRNEDAKR